MATFQERFNQLYSDSKLNQEEFGKLFGASKNQVYDWRHGRGEPDSETMKKIAASQNVSLDYLLGKEFELTNDQRKKLPSVIKYLFDQSLLPANSFEVTNLVANFESLPDNIQKKVIDALLIQTNEGTFNIRNATHKEIDFFEQAKSLPREQRKALIKQIIDDF